MEESVFRNAIKKATKSQISDFISECFRMIVPSLVVKHCYYAPPEESRYNLINIFINYCAVNLSDIDDLFNIDSAYTNFFTKSNFTFLTIEDKLAKKRIRSISELISYMSNIVLDVNIETHYSTSGFETDDITARGMYGYVDAAARNRFKSAIINNDLFAYPDRFNDFGANVYGRFIEILNKNNLQLIEREYNNIFKNPKNIDRITRWVLMPEEIKRVSQEGIELYLSDFLKKTDEARAVFLGNGASGKTSLINRIFEEEINKDKKLDFTPGVQIREREESIDGNLSLIHYWDFGGQVIMHATHKFFLRDQSVNVVVTESRKIGMNDNRDLQYWLEHVKTFSNGSPTIIVYNKIDEFWQFDVEEELKGTYPFIVDFIKISCLTGEGIEDFKQVLKRALSSTKALRSTTTPKGVYDLKVEIKNCFKNKRDHITRNEYFEISDALKITNKNAEAYLEILNNLAVALSYRNIPNSIILNPEWLTKAIYQLLMHDITKEKKGRIENEDFWDIFSKESYLSDPEFRIQNIDANEISLLKAMIRNFEIGFEDISSSKWILPAVLPKFKERYFNNNEDTISIKVQFTPFLPPNLFPTFIVQIYQYILGENVWQNAVILNSDNCFIWVEINEFYRKIEIVSDGKNLDFFTLIRQKLQNLLNNYSQLGYELIIFSEDQTPINLKTFLAMLLEKEEKISTPNGSKQIAPIVVRYYGDIQKNRNTIVKVLNNDISSFQSFNLEAKNTDSILININNIINIKIDSKVEAMLRSELDELKWLFKASETLPTLVDKVERLEELLYKQSVTGNQEEKATILNKFKENWDKLAKECDSIDKVSKIIEIPTTISKISQMVSKIPWSTIACLLNGF